MKNRLNLINIISTTVVVFVMVLMLLGFNHIGSNLVAWGAFVGCTSYTLSHAMREAPSWSVVSNGIGLVIGYIIIGIVQILGLGIVGNSLVTAIFSGLIVFLPMCCYRLSAPLLFLGGLSAFAMGGGLENMVWLGLSIFHGYLFGIITEIVIYNLEERFFK